MLNVDKFFYTALSTDTEVGTLVNGRIYNPARTIEQEEADVVPYIIITYDGGTSSSSSKDDVLTTLDGCTVSVLCVAQSRDSLATMMEAVENAIINAFDDDEFYDSHDDWNFFINDASESASAVQFDPTKPCCFQTLTYSCSTSIR